MAGVKETPVRREVDVRTAVALAFVGSESLDRSEGPVGITERHQLVTQLAEQVGESSVGAESQMAGAEFPADAQPAPKPPHLMFPGYLHV